MGRIQLKEVTKSFGDVEVIPPLDLTIEDGEFAVFVGPSGCGKSTLLRLIAGFEHPTSGKITPNNPKHTQHNKTNQIKHNYTKIIIHIQIIT